MIRGSADEEGVVIGVASRGLLCGFGFGFELDVGEWEKVGMLVGVVVNLNRGGSFAAKKRGGGLLTPA
jgi:hypothetical protein